MKTLTLVTEPSQALAPGHCSGPTWQCCESPPGCLRQVISWHVHSPPSRTGTTVKARELGGSRASQGLHTCCDSAEAWHSVSSFASPCTQARSSREQLRVRSTHTEAQGTVGRDTGALAVLGIPSQSQWLQRVGGRRLTLGQGRNQERTGPSTVSAVL